MLAFIKFSSNRFLMYILASEFLDKYVFKATTSCCVKGIFSLIMRLYRFFRNRSDAYLYLYIGYLENSRLKTVFRYTISFAFVFAGTGY